MSSSHRKPWSILAQAAFDAAWELRTDWYKGRPSAAKDRFWALVPTPTEHDFWFAKELAQAEIEARRDAKASSLELDWLREIEPRKAEFFIRDFSSSQDAERDERISQGPHAEAIRNSGDFELIRCVGKGAHGVVYMVRNVSLKKVRALKLPNPASQDPIARARFQRDGEVLDSLRHPNLVGTYGQAALPDRTPYIEMDFVFGPTLRTLAEYHQTGPLPLGLATDLVRQAAEALAYACSASPNLAHRDVKPENVLLEFNASYPSKWRAVLCDFGLAAGEAFQNLTEVNAIAGGTLLYFAPERFRKDGHKADEQKFDIFSLGVIAFEILTGKHPFAGESRQVTIDNLLACKPPEFSTPPGGAPRVPATLQHLIRRMLLREPKDRPTARVIADQAADILKELSKHAPAALEATSTASASPPEEPADQAKTEVTVDFSPKIHELCALATERLFGLFRSLSPQGLLEIRKTIGKCLCERSARERTTVEACHARRLAELAVDHCEVDPLVNEVFATADDHRCDPKDIVTFGEIACVLLPINADRELIRRVLDSSAASWVVRGIVGTSTFAELVMAAADRSAAIFEPAERATMLRGKFAMRWHTPLREDWTVAGSDDKLAYLYAIDFVEQTCDTLDKYDAAHFPEHKWKQGDDRRPLASCDLEGLGKELKSLKKMLADWLLQDAKRNRGRRYYNIMRFPDDPALAELLVRALELARGKLTEMPFVELVPSLGEAHSAYTRGLHFLLVKDRNRASRSIPRP